MRLVVLLLMCGVTLSAIGHLVIDLEFGWRVLVGPPLFMLAGWVTGEIAKRLRRHPDA